MPKQVLHQTLHHLSDQLQGSLSQTNYKPPEGSNVSIKSMLQSIVSENITKSDSFETLIRAKVRNFSLLCAALASSQVSTSEHLLWIPNTLSIAANSAFRELVKAFCSDCNVENSWKISELGLNLSVMSDEQKLVIELMPQVMPLLKENISESSIDKSDEAVEISAASARAPVAYAIVAAYQMRWFISKVEYPSLGKLCSLVIPCCLTALDHWSPQVKGQGIISFIHLAKNVNATEFGMYEDVILDACCQNITSDDEIWVYVVEMSVLLVTCLQQSNPRSSWYEKLLNEMLSHLERQRRNKERRIAWLKHIDPLFSGVGLILSAHFRRIFPLFFKWMHADDHETVLLVLDRIKLVIKLTWRRNSPHIERLVDELVTVYKEAALKIEREAIRTRVLHILSLLHQCKSQQFEGAWNKHKDDPNLQFECIFVEGSLLKKVLESIKDLVNDANFDFSATFSLQAMDSSHVALVALLLRSDGFEHYCCDRNISMGTNLVNMVKMLRCAGNDDIVTIKADDGGDVITFMFESPTQDKISDFEMKLMDIDSQL